MAGFPVLSTMHGRLVSDLYAVPHLTNYAGVVDSDTLVPSLGRNVARENSLSSFSHADNTEFQEQYGGGTIVSGASRNNFQEHLNGFVHPFDITRTHAGYSSALNLAFATSMNCGYDEVVGNVNLRWDFDKFPISPELGGKSLDPSGWISSNNVDHLFGSSMFNDQNSLRLAPSQSSVSRTSNVLDQFSEMSCSAVTHHCLNETGLGAEQNSCSSKELSLSFGSQNPPNPTQATPGSIYLQIVQDILSQIASYTLENLDLTGYYNGELRTGLNLEYYSSCPADGSSFVDPELQKQAVESKKAQLMTLLQVVDDQYNQCIDEIHTVVSAFHAATELDPKKHASFALRTVSFLYKNLRQRISSQILSIGADSYSKGRKSDMSFEASFIQKQWSLQQQKRKEQQLWRPQRGLPEKSVSVLRAWMFQNFLHPYPKDAEKHLLAVKSGLSRSQVSNWFINARVRLWKPMIEEMYSELNKRKACDDQ